MFSAHHTAAIGGVLATLLAGICTPVAAAVVGPVSLPDVRAWEQVSPVDKNESDVKSQAAVASSDGNSVVLMSRGSFAGEQSAQAQNFYLSKRSPTGWTTNGIMPAGGTLNFENGYMGFTSDLSQGVLRWREENSAIDPEAVTPGSNLYLRNDLTGSFELINGTLAQQTASGGFDWGSVDFNRIGFETEEPLTADSPCHGHVRCAYEWSEGTLRLASVLPNGGPATGVVGDGYESGHIDHAVSDDGRRLFFGSPDAFYGMELYVREGHASTLLSGSERTLPAGVTGSDVYYQGAEAAHGDRVMFTTKNALVDGDTNETNDLYLYDFTKPVSERLTLVSEDRNPNAPDGADVATGQWIGNPSPAGGVMADSEDLRRIYFVTNNQILPEEPEERGPKLYLWDGAESTLKFIATLAPNDAADWDSTPIYIWEHSKQARISPDGRFLAFMSTAQLTAADHNGEADVYLYDAMTQALRCLSCGSEAAPAGGAVSFDQTGSEQRPVNHLLNNVSDTGQVFFQTTRGLVSRDSNGAMDVYEYENGQLYLISSGTGGTDSYFLDASPSGDDVFFVTRDRLVGWDEDTNYDAYDARDGGGLPEPPPLPPACEGDACLPPPNVLDDPTPASVSFVDASNVSARIQSGVHPVRKVVKRCRVRGRFRSGSACKKKKRVVKRRAKGSRRSGRRAHGGRNHG